MHRQQHVRVVLPPTQCARERTHAQPQWVGTAPALGFVLEGLVLAGDQNPSDL